MERRRSQQQRLKQQQRFSVSQQDLTEAMARMKPVGNLDQPRSIRSASLSVERLTNPSVSQLIKEFEARANLTPYASAQDLLPLASNQTKSNDGHMPARVVQIKGTHANKNVCSSIFPSISDDNQLVLDDFHREKVNNVMEKEEKKPEIQQKTSQQDDLSTGSSTLNQSNESLSMVTRSTDLDEAAAATSKLQRNHVQQLDQLLDQEAQLNKALADLMLISNDISNLSTSPLKGKTANSIASSIELLNNLIETIDIESTKNDPNDVKPVNVFRVMSPESTCANCQQLFATNEQIVNAAGQLWHIRCFVCTQCFQPFDKGIYYEHEGRNYCQRDFQMLFAPCCAECEQPIIGRVIRALGKCFHPDCFRCQSCRLALTGLGFLKFNGQALCRPCHTKEKSKELTISQKICSKCHQIIQQQQNFFKYKGEYFHPHHFRCTSCNVELNENTREHRGLLYCFSCYTKLEIPVCASCHQIIENRIVDALGKKWHPEHFCCARCGREFYGNQHYEHEGLAYCQTDYQYLFGSNCFVCKEPINDGAFVACRKKFCAEHFTCSICEKKFNKKSKFYDVDAMPVCKSCFNKLPSKTRKSSQETKSKRSLLRQTSV